MRCGGCCRALTKSGVDGEVSQRKSTIIHKPGAGWVMVCPHCNHHQPLVRESNARIELQRREK